MAAGRIAARLERPMTVFAGQQAGFAKEAQLGLAREVFAPRAGIR